MKFSKIMAVMIACAVLGLNAAAAVGEAFDVNGVRYTVTGTNTVKAGKISDKKKPKGKLEIPSKVQNGGLEYTVNEIGGWGFFGSNELTELVLPESIEQIGYFAFSNCEGLKKAVVKCGKASIKDALFSGCKSLTDVSLAEGLTSLGDRSLEETPITEVKLPSTLKVISGSMFNGCKSLKRVAIPDGVVKIDHYAFAMCDSLEEVVLPKSLEVIGKNAFSGCKQLNELVLPEGLKRIDGDAFSRCDKFEKLRLPASLDEVNGNPFMYCNSLKKLEISEGNPNFKMDGGVVLTGDGTKVVFSLRFAEIGDYVVPETVTTIGSYAFYNNQNLTSVKMGKNVKYIHGAAFHDCGNLSKVEMAEGLEEIGDKAFYSCRSLTSVRLPSTLVYVGQNAFDFCSELREVSVDESLVKNEQVFTQWVFGFTDSGLQIKVRMPDGQEEIKKVEDLPDPKKFLFHDEVIR
ncbi:MAG: leucine-rich repeat domain-containing protein [Muribaculaceae bacterium]|nr:leucine-rich repeat domain-containing protein [Muribaculaceae bacterium]